MMKLNVLAIAFLPGVGLVGYLMNGSQGMAWTLAIWGLATTVGTLVHAGMHLNQKRIANLDRDAPPPGYAAPDATAAALAERAGFEPAEGC
jgi:hypothetical protein